MDNAGYERVRRPIVPMDAMQRVFSRADVSTTNGNKDMEAGLDVRLVTAST